MAATDHVARFDRRQCKPDAPFDPAGTECPEGWRFYPIPGPAFSIASPTAGADVVLRGALAARTTDFLHGITVDRLDVLGLNAGRDLPFAIVGNSDAVLALLPEQRRIRIAASAVSARVLRSFSRSADRRRKTRVEGPRTVVELLVSGDVAR